MKHGHLLYLFESCMVEGGDVCESTIMKEKNLQRNMGRLQEDTKLANLKSDIVLAVKYLEQTLFGN